MGQEHKEYTWNLIAKKLSGEASPQELRELEDLLKNNPELHYPMQTISDMWKPSSRETQKTAERAFNKHLDRMKDLNISYESQEPASGGSGPNDFRPDAGEPASNYADGMPGALPVNRLKRARRMTLAISALCLLIITGIWVYQWSAGSPYGSAIPSTVKNVKTLQGNEVSTSNGSRTNVVLPDGTRIWLNAGSRIVYAKNFGTVQREVDLVGEAFFDVARNAEKPFIIHTARLDIRVLGTSFNVKSYSSDKTTEATLVRGSIEVALKDRPAEKIILKPNEKLVVTNGDSILRRDHPGRHIPDTGLLVRIIKPTYEPVTGAMIETSWVENKLTFRDEEFRELARQMERWYGVTIRFSSALEEEWRFTGNFQKETIQQALDALKITQPFNYTFHENQITIYDR